MRSGRGNCLLPVAWVVEKTATLVCKLRASTTVLCPISTSSQTCCQFCAQPLRSLANQMSYTDKSLATDGELPNPPSSGNQESRFIGRSTWSTWYSVLLCFFSQSSAEATTKALPKDKNAPGFAAAMTALLSRAYSLRFIPLRLYTDAVRVGRLHTMCEGWADASLQYMGSGGFTVSTKVPKIGTETLVLWGRQDKILDPKLYAER